MLLSFPLINIVFLILIYRVHRTLFWVIGILEAILYVAGVAYIELTYTLVTNQIIYYLALTGLGLILGFSGFLLAISLNHKNLYEEAKK